MSRTKQECYTYTCDVCQLDFESDDGVTMHFDVRGGDGPSNWGDWHDWGDYGWHIDCKPVCDCGDRFEAHDMGDQPCEDCECKAFNWKPRVTT